MGLRNYCRRLRDWWDGYDPPNKGLIDVRPYGWKPPERIRPWPARAWKAIYQRLRLRKWVWIALVGAVTGQLAEFALRRLFG
jgi:hypothetical protein